MILSGASNFQGQEPGVVLQHASLYMYTHHAIVLSSCPWRLSRHAIQQWHPIKNDGPLLAQHGHDTRHSSHKIE